MSSFMQWFGMNGLLLVPVLLFLLWLADGWEKEKRLREVIREELAQSEGLFIQEKVKTSQS